MIVELLLDNRLITSMERSDTSTSFVNAMRNGLVSDIEWFVLVLELLLELVTSGSSKICIKHSIANGVLCSISEFNYIISTIITITIYMNIYLHIHI